MYRRYSPYGMWNEMDRFQREMNRTFDRALSSRYPTIPEFPALNVWRDEAGAVVTAELPGLKLEDIEISVTGDTLTLKGDYAQPEKDEDIRYHRQERRYGKFSRSLQLPFNVDAEKVEASYKNGVLKISLPQSEADKPKKIQIKTA